jgi:hypothetical protein
MQELLKSNEFRFVVDYFKHMDFSDREIYANWLAQTYYFVSHSVRLSSLAAAKLPVDSAIGQRMAAHTVEEKGHHTVAIKDIESLGKKITDYPPFGVTSAFYQAQYYKVLFEHPHHLLGQIFMLEALAVEAGPWMHRLVKKCYGAQGTRFVRIHEHEDQDHVTKAIQAMNSFSDEHKAGTKENFFQACEVYYYILRSVNEAAYSALCRSDLKRAA